MNQLNEFDGRLLNSNDTIMYQVGMAAMEKRDAPSQLRGAGPYRGKIVDFADEMRGVCADGRSGSVPLSSVWVSDIVGVE